jgi:uncharacterized protein YuzB (UPF0349 family)
VEYCPNGVFAFINGKAVVANPKNVLVAALHANLYATKKP